MLQSSSMGAFGATGDSAESSGIDPRQTELQQLQREYRHMEINRRAYAEESQSLLRKQQTTIDKLRKENEALKNDIALIMRGSNKAMNNSTQDFIQQLTDTGDQYASSIEYERANIQTMEEQIHLLRQKTLQQRRAMGGVNASKENHNMIQKQIRILENRLDKSLIKFNESIAHNKKLRDQIDDLRRERVVFENIYRKMERELQERKKHMAEIIEVSNQSYEQRDTFQMEVAAIEQANRKEQEEFEEQMLTLSHMLDTELQLPSVGASLGSRTKSVTRFNNTSNSAKTLPGAGFSSRNNSPMKGGVGGSLNGTTAGGGDGGDDPNNMTTDGTGVLEIDFHERAQNFEEAFNKIKSATGITDVDELVKTFIKNEEHNFSLFNYVNEQNNEIEKYEEQIQQLKEEELKYAQESGNDVHQHKEILKDLESKLHTSELMAEKYEQRCQELQRITESLKRGMQSIFSKFDFDGEEGSVAPVVTEANMVHHLGMIERKTNQLLQGYTCVRSLLYAPGVGKDPSAKDSTATGADVAEENDADPAQALVAVLGVGPKVPMGQDLLHVNPPKSEDYKSDDSDDDDDGDTRPLTRDELKHRTLNRLQKKLGLNVQGTMSISATGNPVNTPSGFNGNTM